MEKKKKNRVGKGLEARKTIKKTSLIQIITAVKKAGGKRQIQMPRILPIPSSSIGAVGRALPFLIPLFAGSSATGALAGGAALVVKAVNSGKAAHSKGYGIHLTPYVKREG